MNTKLIQSASSIFLAVTALICIFIPDEISEKFLISNNEFIPLLIQVLGGLLFGFAVINWMSRTITMGGIYGKAIYMGNFAQFIIGGLALLKWNIRNKFPSEILVLILTGYIIFLILYLLIFLSSPRIAKKIKD